MCEKWAATIFTWTLDYDDVFPKSQHGFFSLFWFDKTFHISHNYRWNSVELFHGSEKKTEQDHYWLLGIGRLTHLKQIKRWAVELCNYKDVLKCVPRKITCCLLVILTQLGEIINLTPSSNHLPAHSLTLEHEPKQFAIQCCVEYSFASMMLLKVRHQFDA